jgi:hypothetical protein
MTGAATLTASALNKRLALLQGNDDLDKWFGPALDTIPEEFQEVYLLNKLAVTMWVRLRTEQDILREVKSRSGVDMRQGRVAKLVHRCLKKNPDTGTIYGFYGCVPGAHLHNDAAPLKGEAPAGHERQLRQMFKEHPKIEAALIRLVKTRRLKKDGPQFPAMNVGVIVECFYTLCQEAGLEEAAKWPFSNGLKKKGYEAIRRWYHQKKFDNPSQAALNELGDEVGVILGRDLRRIGIRSLNIPLKMGYERVEIDEHCRDAMFSAVWPTVEGEYRTLPASRVWALVAVECAFHAVLGTHVALGDRYNRNDVSRLMLNVVCPPPRPTQLMFDDPQYRLLDGAMYPGELPGFERNSFQTLAWDGHRSHMSKQMVADVMTVMHCHVAAERIGDPTARPNIEGWFNVITRFDHRLPSSTGSRPDSPERRDPEGLARKYQVYMPFASESLDVVGRMHNITSLKCLDGATPLERMCEMAKQGRIFHSPIGALSTSQLHLFLPRYACELREFRAVGDGHGVLGVNLGYCRYTSKELNECKELRFAADKSCTLFVNEDARSAWLVVNALSGRRFLVTLAGRWAAFPHTLQFRLFLGSFAMSRGAEWKAKAPQLAVGAMRGLAAAAEDNTAAARMMAGTNGFAERLMRGQVTEVDATRTEVEDALAYSLRLEPEDDLGAPPTDALELATVDEDAAAPSTRDPLGGVADPFGLRK